MSNGLKIVLAILAITLVVMFMIGGKLISGYNQVIAMEENVKGKWAQVENQLKRRYDLIPNLVETVKGYAKHEKDIFENINSNIIYFSICMKFPRICAGFYSHRAGVFFSHVYLQERF